jgi:hypothetical protein
MTGMALDEHGGWNINVWRTSWLSPTTRPSNDEVPGEGGPFDCFADSASRLRCPSRALAVQAF